MSAMESTQAIDSREPDLARGLSAQPASVDYFNRRHPFHVIKGHVALRARRRMYQRVIEIAKPTRLMRIVDVGTTPDLHLPYNNFFERWFPHTDRLAACSIEDCSNLEASFPGLAFTRIAGDNLPYRDGQFDLALSFAVLEHVGSAEKQRHFLAELARIARAFIVFTPYRYFPVEMHTLLPLLHWLPVERHRAILKALGMTFWADEKNLNLVSLASLQCLLPPTGDADVRLLWSLGWPSNIEIYWRRSPAGG
jgi:Methyltransferase domain